MSAWGGEHLPQAPVMAKPLPPSGDGIDCLAWGLGAGACSRCWFRPPLALQQRKRAQAPSNTLSPSERAPKGLTSAEAPFASSTCKT
jgi:hypothetical protein